MTETRTITIAVPRHWHADENHYGDLDAWAHQPGATAGDTPVRDLDLAAVVVAALPRMTWGILDESREPVDVFPSEAHARIEAAACRQLGDVNVVVHRLDDGDDWLDDTHIAYPADRHPVGQDHAVRLDSARDREIAIEWAEHLDRTDPLFCGWVKDAILREITARDTASTSTPR
jgi:hypothetical protein